MSLSRVRFARRPQCAVRDCAKTAVFPPDSPDAEAKPLDGHIVSAHKSDRTVPFIHDHVTGRLLPFSTAFCVVPVHQTRTLSAAS
eukprot:m.209474 g.209474  ORF g.209474 m.209474 type:complete len:85 (+) comp15046_c0_seq1:504-758(+)